MPHGFRGTVRIEGAGRPSAEITVVLELLRRFIFLPLYVFDDLPRFTLYLDYLPRFRCPLIICPVLDWLLDGLLFYIF